MAHGKMKSAVTAHGCPADAPLASDSHGAISAVDFGHQLLNEEVLVPFVAVLRVYVKGPSPSRQDHNEIREFALVGETFPDLFASPIDPTVLVFKEAMEEVKGWITLVGRCFVARGENNAKAHGVP
jgi:hypothetical protein